MKDMKISSGTGIMDSMLDGGYDSDIITTIYGPAGSGKTNLCLLAAISVAKDRKKVIYIDTEGGFSVSRLNQLTDAKEILKDIIFLKPTSFSEQKKAFQKLKKLITAEQNIGLIIVDTIAMLYRLEIGKSDDVYETNRELGKQLANLTMVARKKRIPILITNQVYSNFNEPNSVSMVGGDLLRYGSKCLIELKISQDKLSRTAILKKHRSLAQEKTFDFRIVEKGIEPV